jgi:hypothetical protein
MGRVVYAQRLSCDRGLIVPMFYSFMAAGQAALNRLALLVNRRARPTRLGAGLFNGVSQR